MVMSPEWNVHDAEEHLQRGYIGQGQAFGEPSFIFELFYNVDSNFD